MKIARLLWEEEMVQSVSEATRMIKQGAVWAGFCAPDCSFFSTGRCTCGGWKKVINPAEDSPDDDIRRFRVGGGCWRIVPRMDRQEGETMFRQLRGIC